jgi:hypothetical protein
MTKLNKVRLHICAIGNEEVEALSLKPSTETFYFTVRSIIPILVNDDLGAWGMILNKPRKYVCCVDLCTTGVRPDLSSLHVKA